MCNIEIGKVMESFHSLFGNIVQWIMEYFHLCLALARLSGVMVKCICKYCIEQSLVLPMNSTN